MNVIIVGTAYPYRGGIAAFNERLASEFLAKGDKVQIVTFTLQYPKLLFPGKTQYSNGEAPKNYQITRIINSINPISWRKAARFITKQNPDVVIFSYWTFFMSYSFGKIASILKKKTNTKCIGLIHNMMPHEPSIFDKTVPKYFVNKMDGFIALSKSVVEDIKRFDKNNKPKVFSPHPVYDHYGELINKNDALDYLKLDKSKRYVLFFGLVRMYKGLDLLLKAFADERIKKMGIKLLVAGEFYDDPKIYYDIIEEYNIKDNILINNAFILDNEIKYYFCGADIIAQPYKSATQSGVTQIAYHFNRPMLVTNVGGLPEIVKHNSIGYVVEPNPTDIANALVDFFTNNREEEFSKQVEVEKEKLSWSVFVEELKTLLNN
ncbi:MAG: glycosyltransferase [Bacteroidales bacterium]|jgi:D-inositol-3-phosphate glycosyltransferase